MSDDSASRLLRGWLAGGLSNAITSAILNPMDVSKTRLQVERRSFQAPASHLTLRSVMKKLFVEQGLVGLWLPGLFASVLREMIFLQ